MRLDAPLRAARSLGQNVLCAQDKPLCIAFPADVHIKARIRASRMGYDCNNEKRDGFR